MSSISLGRCKVLSETDIPTQLDVGRFEEWPSLARNRFESSDRSAAGGRPGRVVLRPPVDEFDPLGAQDLHGSHLKNPNLKEPFIYFLNLCFLLFGLVFPGCA